MEIPQLCSYTHFELRAGHLVSAKKLPNPSSLLNTPSFANTLHLVYSFKMVHTASAVAFAVVAFNVASTMANPIYEYVELSPVLYY